MRVMMRVNDIFYALPTLPLLILLSITFGRSIFLIIGFLLIFSWMGTAKVIRSIALQTRNFQYVEAAKLMGQSDLKVIFKHIIPQLLPLTFASIAIAVPAAILTEAALSFLGLGDPSLPTWGQTTPRRKHRRCRVTGYMVVDCSSWAYDCINRSGIFLDWKYVGCYCKSTKKQE